MKSWFYAAHGVLIHSQTLLAAYNPVLEPNGQPEVQIRVHEEPTAFDSEHGFLVANGEFRIWFSVLGEFRVTPDGVIRAICNPGYAASSLHLALQGSVLAVALFFRGILPMHGNSLSINGEGTLIVGEKGQGKSTLTAALLAKGHRLISDDVSGITFDSAGAARVHRGSLQLKLWPDSVERCLGRNAQDFPTIDQWQDKRIISAHSHQCEEENLPLKRIYILCDDKEHSLRVEPLPREEGLRNVLANSHLTRFGSELLQGMTGVKHFSGCSKLAQAVPVARLFRPRDFDRLPEVMKFIENAGRDGVPA